DDLIALMLQHLDPLGDLRQPCVAGLHALQQQSRRLADDVHLAEKQCVELLFAWQQSHKERLSSQLDVGTVNSAGVETAQLFPPARSSGGTILVRPKSHRLSRTL